MEKFIKYFLIGANLLPLVIVTILSSNKSPKINPKAKDYKWAFVSGLYPEDTLHYGNKYYIKSDRMVTGGWHVIDDSIYTAGLVVPVRLKKNI